MRESRFGKNRGVWRRVLASTPRIAARVVPLSIMLDVEDQNKRKQWQRSLYFTYAFVGGDLYVLRPSTIWLYIHCNSPPEKD